MALSDADLISAGYHKNECGNWQLQQHILMMNLWKD